MGFVERGEGSIRLWDAVTGQPKHALSSRPRPTRDVPWNYPSIAFSPDGNSVEAGVNVLYEPLGSFTSEVWLWDVTTG